MIIEKNEFCPDIEMPLDTLSDSL